MIIRVKDLKLRAIIGCNEWEREKRQDVVLNIAIESDLTEAFSSDRLEDTVDYRALTKRIIKAVEESEFFLIEKLARKVLDIVMEGEGVKGATVEIDKPNALRFSDSVSVEVSAER